MFRKLLDQGQAGDNIGCLLRGIEKDDVERGQVLCAPGTVKPHKKFEGEVYVLKKEEGGRHKPFFTNYRPQFYMRTTDVTGTIELPEDVKMVMPGDNVTHPRRAHHAGRARSSSSASRSARAARPWAPASSRRSSSKLAERDAESCSFVRSAGRETTRRRKRVSRTQKERLALKKFCRTCAKHTVHKESK